MIKSEERVRKSDFLSLETPLILNPSVLALEISLVKLYPVITTPIFGLMVWVSVRFQNNIWFFHLRCTAQGKAFREKPKDDEQNSQPFVTTAKDDIEICLNIGYSMIFISVMNLNNSADLILSSWFARQNHETSPYVPNPRLDHSRWSGKLRIPLRNTEKNTSCPWKQHKNGDGKSGGILLKFDSKVLLNLVDILWRNSWESQCPINYKQKQLLSGAECCQP